MRLVIRCGQLVLLSSACISCAPDAPDTGSALERYPPAERGSQVDDYHGTLVADPYRWLEELDAPKTQGWVQAQNSLSEPQLESIPARREIEARLTELWDYERYGVPVKEGEVYFFTRNDGLQDQDVLYAAQALDEEPRVVIDPNSFSDDATVSLASFSPSPDGRHIAYATSDGGSDWKTWKIRNVETGEDLAEELGLIKFTNVAWTSDGSGFYYSRYPPLEGGPPDRGDGSKAVSVYFHRLATSQSDDPLIYSIPEHPRRNPYPTVTEDGRFLIIRVQEGYLENAIYYRSLDEPAAPFVPLLDQWDALYTFAGNSGNTFFFQTNHSAPRNRVVAVDVGRTRALELQEIVPESEHTLRSTTLAGGRLVCHYLADAQSRIVLFDPNGDRVHEVELPAIGSASGLRGDAADTEVFYAFTSFTFPSTVYRLDTGEGTSELLWQPEIDLDLEPYETRQVFYESKDRTRVPMFLIHRRGLELHGANPTLLYGYGGFNVAQTPRFNVARLVWLEMGGVFAVANLRGGGEYGREWHLAGTRSQKQNVFDDFIAAAEWLIAEGYTSTPKLAIQGTSNGGLLVGAAITQRPDLFGAALPAVGVLDMLRYHLASANARNWRTDYGLSEQEEDFKAQYAYSPVHNVKAGSCYPPTLITTADHDDRVVPWHSYKFGATLQHAQGCDNPILIRVETRAGHGAGTPTWMRIEGVADQWAFLAQALNMDPGS